MLTEGEYLADIADSVASSTVTWCRISQRHDVDSHLTAKLVIGMLNRALDDGVFDESCPEREASDD